MDLARRAQPAGRSKLLRVLQARLGNPVAYTGSYPLYVGPGQYDVDPTVDPAVVSPINGGERTLHIVSFVTSVVMMQAASRECVVEPLHL